MDNGNIPEEGLIEPNGPILGGKGYLPAQTVRKAYLELDETAQTRIVCLRSLRQLIEEHQEENNFDEHTDAFLLKFLRHRKFDVDDAYKLLENYYSNRESKPDIFRNLTRKNVRKTLEQGIVCVLPQRDSKGRVIVLFNFAQWNMSLPFHFEKLLRVWVYTLEKVFEIDETQINGIVIVSDLSQLSVLQTKSLGSTMLSKVVSVFQVRGDISCLFYGTVCEIKTIRLCIRIGHVTGLKSIKVFFTKKVYAKCFVVMTVSEVAVTSLRFGEKMKLSTV